MKLFETSENDFGLVNLTTACLWDKPQNWFLGTLKGHKTTSKRLYVHVHNILYILKSKYFELPLQPLPWYIQTCTHKH